MIRETPNTANDRPAVDFFDGTAPTPESFERNSGFLGKPGGSRGRTQREESPGDSPWIEWANNLDASRALGLRCLEMGASGVSMAMTESAWALNPNGAAHGGLVFAAADHCMGVAAYAAQEPGRGAVTVSLTVNYHAPARLPVTFEATVARRTGTITFVELTATGGDGRTCTRATGVWAAPTTGNEWPKESRVTPERL